MDKAQRPPGVWAWGHRVYGAPAGGLPRAERPSPCRCLHGPPQRGLVICTGIETPGRGAQRDTRRPEMMPTSGPRGAHHGDRAPGARTPDCTVLGTRQPPDRYAPWLGCQQQNWGLAPGGEAPACGARAHATTGSTCRDTPTTGSFSPRQKAENADPMPQWRTCHPRVAFKGSVEVRASCADHPRRAP